MNWLIGFAGLMLGISMAGFTACVGIVASALAGASVFERPGVAFFWAIVVTLGTGTTGGWIQTKLDIRNQLLDKVLGARSTL